jgi:hypothetical protein
VSLPERAVDLSLMLATLAVCRTWQEWCRGSSVLVQTVLLLQAYMNKANITSPNKRYAPFILKLIKYIGKRYNNA